MMRVLQLSDPHFGTVVPAAAKALQALARAQKPDLLVLSGDLTQRATQRQFAAARVFCDSLQIAQQLALPGNHDIPLFNPFKRLLNPYGNHLAAFGPLIEPVLDLPSLLVIGVNTTRWYRHKNGEVSAGQVSRIAAQLRLAQPEQLRVVVTHQPVHVMKTSDEHDRLRGWELAVRAWSDAGADIIMGGHIHLPYVCELSTRMAGLRRRIWCVQAGTALSSRTRHGMSNSVNLLRYEPSQHGLQCLLERWDFRPGKGVFEMAHATPLDMDRSST
jgi:3',5'-cyclic AMP phosphodiesterase CpdA